jgi:hypothetical protein
MTESGATRVAVYLDFDKRRNRGHQPQKRFLNFF